jgi:hypothetical protein
MMEELGAPLVLLALLRRYGAATIDGQDIERAYRDIREAREGGEDAGIGAHVVARMVSAPHVAAHPDGGLRTVPALYEVWAREQGRT